MNSNLDSIQANLVQQNQNQPQNPNQNQYLNYSQNDQNQYHQSNFNGGRGGRFGGRRGRGGRSSIQCSICFQYGHDAGNCRHIPSFSFYGTTYPSMTQPMQPMVQPMQVSFGTQQQYAQALVQYVPMLNNFSAQPVFPQQLQQQAYLGTAQSIFPHHKATWESLHKLL